MNRITFCTSAFALWSAISFAQAPAAPAANDQAKQQHLDAARKLAGTQWAAAYNFFCVAPRANAATDPPIQPTKIFDNLYAIGDSGTVAYALTTNEGIVLIDSLPANQTESVLLAGMKTLGLDPAKVKYVIVTHGHGDHSGGSAYFQEKYGAHVILSGQDWEMMLQSANAKGKAADGKAKAAARNPNLDMIAANLQPMEIGGTTITPVLIPGHTPGSLGLIFPVKEGSTTHTAALFGGTILLPARPDVATLQTYLRSIENFKAAAKDAKVDVEVQNHPLMDGFVERLAALKNRAAGAPNPFIVGQQGYMAFLDVMAECVRAQRPEIPAALPGLPVANRPPSSVSKGKAESKAEDKSK